MEGREDNKRPPLSPFCLRLTLQERQILEREAGDAPVGAYIRSRLFAQDHPRPRLRPRRPGVDREALGRLLAGLGESRIASNLDQLARAASSGSLPVCDDTARQIVEACTHVQWMRRTLIAALAIEPKEERTE
ncbi:MAG: hypothetical protein H6862_02925 [Rhodospirillales bacterium]|nr:hypothetical protein [Rhodospirillales bacterium]